MKKKYFTLIIIGITALAIQATLFIPSSTKASLSKGFKKSNINKVGKEQVDYTLNKLYTRSYPLFSPLDKDELLPLPDAALESALAHHKQLLEYKDSKHYYSDSYVSITKGKLDTAAHLLHQWSQGGNIPLSQLFDTYLLKGRDQKGNLKFTGYFSPIIAVNSSQTEEYPFPIYQKPAGGELIPTREEILNGALAGKGLELAWAKTRKDISYLQLQGSGFAQYPNGKVEYLAYGGNNARNASNSMPVEPVKMMENEADEEKTTPSLNVRPGYTFFERSKNSTPIGAGSVPLTPEISVAVDSRIVPLGACLLAEFPVIDEKGRLLYHEYKILLAQDTGGAIKGAGRMDFYTGIGKAAEAKARYLSHYGRVWILMPKAN